MEAPSNPALAKAIEEVRAAAGEEWERKLKALLEQLVAATMIAGEDDGEPVTVEIEEGEWLALFTDLVELHFFEPGRSWQAFAVEDAIRLVAGGDYGGFVINPGVC